MSPPRSTALPANTSGETRSASSAAASIALATLAAYLPALHGSVLWNDRDYLTAPALRGLRGLALIWLKPGATQQYYPILHSVFWLEHLLWADAMPGYHLANVCLHAAAACLFARSVQILGLGRRPAWFAGLVFAVHPIGCESVAWITEQKNTLSAVFYFAALLTYLRFDDRRTAGSYAAAAVLYVCALLSKTTTVTLPCSLLILAWVRRGRLGLRNDLLPLVPWALIGIACAGGTSWVERNLIGAEGSAFSLSFVQRLLVTARACAFYAGKDLWPSQLTFFYPKWRPDPAAWAQWIWPLAVVLTLVGAWRFRSHSRVPFGLALLFLVALFPTLGFFNFYGSLYSLVADHWQYLACPVTIAALGAMGARLLQPRPRAALVCAICAPVALGAATWKDCMAYRNNETLYRATLARNPNCWMAWNNLGELRMEAGDFAGAAADFEQSARIEPAFFEVHDNLGNAWTRLGRSGDAVREYRTALAIRPGIAEIHNNLANRLARLGNADEAAGEYREALRLAPHYPEAHNNLGNLWARTGHFPQAEAEYRLALTYRPDYPEAENGLGNALAQEGRLNEAVECYRRALQSRPDYAEARHDLQIVREKVERMAPMR